MTLGIRGMRRTLIPSHKDNKTMGQGNNRNEMKSQNTHNINKLTTQDTTIETCQSGVCPDSGRGMADHPRPSPSLKGKKIFVAGTRSECNFKGVRHICFSRPCLLGYAEKP